MRSVCHRLTHTEAHQDTHTISFSRPSNTRSQANDETHILRAHAHAYAHTHTHTNTHTYTHVSTTNASPLAHPKHPHNYKQQRFKGLALGTAQHYNNFL